MRRRMMKSKIHRATVTDANLHYVGSITVDRDLMDAGRPPRVRAGRRRRHRQRRPPRDLRHRGRAGLAATICLNGAAARLVSPGDQVILISYADYERGRARGLRAHASSTSTRANRPSTRLTAELLAAEQHGPAPRRYVEVDA